MISRRLSLMVVLAGALLFTGCTPTTPVFPVEGVVTFENGRPALELAGGTVSFESTADQSNAVGEIQADGAYRLMSPTGADGVRAGAYRVLVLPPEPKDADNPPPRLLHLDCQSYARSGIRVTVEEKVNQIPIKVKRN